MKIIECLKTIISFHPIQLCKSRSSFICLHIKHLKTHFWTLMKFIILELPSLLNCNKSTIIFSSSYPVTWGGYKCHVRRQRHRDDVRRIILHQTLHYWRIKCQTIQWFAQFSPYIKSPSCLECYCHGRIFQIKTGFHIY